MNFYAHYIGDYDKDTGDLSPEEDAMYSRLLRAYYGTEKPIENVPDRLAAICRPLNAKHRAAILTVAKRYFYVGKDGKLHNRRADSEIRKARVRIKAASANGKLGGRPKKPSDNPAGFAKESSPSPSFPTGRGMGEDSGGISPSPQLQTALVEPVVEVSPSGRLRMVS